MREINGIKKISQPMIYDNNTLLSVSQAEEKGIKTGNCYKNTIAYPILMNHNTSDNDVSLKIKFDAMASHDITYVGIIQTARASGLSSFPIPYVLTNCHNSLCAVGGTINEDDHVFGLSAAKKYGGIFVPPHIAVIHQYMREMFAGCGKMILGSDSHTRYGALGTIAVGEGGPELVKQLLKRTYDISRPDVVGIHLTGCPQHGVGPQDVALSIIGATFEDGFVKNSIMEFFGDGIQNLSVDYRIGIDVMTTETTCLSSIWETDEKVENWLDVHGRKSDYKQLVAKEPAMYDRILEVDLSKIKPVIAMPFHPSNVYSIEEVCANPYDVIKEVEDKANATLSADGVKLSLTDKIINNKLYINQGVIAGCAGGGFENLVKAAEILDNANIGSGEFSLSVYPASQPVYMELVRNGTIEKLAGAGAIIKTAFCGPCFGAGDVPSNNALSIRHSTRNFPNREGSKPSGGQIASVALMDARSIAATAANGGILTSASDYNSSALTVPYHFDKTIYDKRVFKSNSPENDSELKFGPNITDWPEQIALCDNILLRIDSKITDPVTTTDELIPSGETSSYRSNPHKLSEFTLSRKDPGYVQRAKETRALETSRRNGVTESDIKSVFEAISKINKFGADISNTEIGSVVCAIKPGDGSAREQAASCQRVLGGLANISVEYATKRYRSNLINWGMLPFTADSLDAFKVGAYVFVPYVKNKLLRGDTEFNAYIIDGSVKEITLHLHNMTDDEKDIISKGCLINYYAE